MSLEGLRAWIAEVERKLAMRTRVFLALSLIAVGLGGAAIYLAIDARESSVSEGDVQALQERLEGQIGTGGSGAPAAGIAELEAEVGTLQAEVAELHDEGGKPQLGPSGGTGSSGGGTGGTGGASSGAANGASSGTTGGAPSSEASSKARLQELLERAKDQNAQAEREQAEK
jgi:hypothetical protein